MPTAVLGDSGKLYVSPECIPIYKAMLPLSTIITPNWFEVECVQHPTSPVSFVDMHSRRILTGVQLTDLASLQNALRILHTELRVPNVVISSIPFRPWLQGCVPPPLRASGASADDNFLLCICSAARRPGVSTVHAQRVALIPGYFSGVGDLFSALVLAHFAAPHHPPPTPSADADGVPAPAPPALAWATACALAKTHAVLARTHARYAALPVEEQVPTDEELDMADPERRVTRMRARELRLVQSQDIIRDGVKNEAMVEWNEFWAS